MKSKKSLIKWFLNIFSYLFLIQPLLEGRAEILKKNRWFFGQNDDNQKTFRDELTFSWEKFKNEPNWDKSKLVT